MKKTLVTATWCGPCGVLKRRLKELEIEVETKSPDTDKDFCMEHTVRSVPCLVIEADGAVSKVTGIEDIVKALQS